MECFICGKDSLKGYLCKKHSEELFQMLSTSKNIIKEPQWPHHCQICGEYQNRKIIEYPSVGYFCDKDIKEEYELNNKK